MAVEVDALNPDIAESTLAVPVPVAVMNTDAKAGADVNTVSPLLPVAKVDAADSVAEEMFVTALAVRDELATAPQTDIVQLVDCAAHDKRCPTAYSPPVREIAPNVNGWILLLAHPCCRVDATPVGAVPTVHDTVRDALV